MSTNPSRVRSAAFQSEMAPPPLVTSTRSPSNAAALGPFIPLPVSVASTSPVAARTFLGIAFVVALAASAATAVGRSHHLDEARSVPAERHDVARIRHELAGGRISLAAFEWSNAYAVAVAGREWRDLVAVGDAALAIGDAAGTRVGWTAKARDCYRSALYRARAEESLDGALAATQALAGLGDPDGVAHAIAVARALAADPASQARVQDVASRLDQRVFATAESPRKRF
jgi:hypothetical protein